MSGPNPWVSNGRGFDKLSMRHSIAVGSQNKDLNSHGTTESLILNDNSINISTLIVTILPISRLK